MSLKIAHAVLAAKLIALLCLPLLPSGCATAIRGTSQLVPVDSVPTGAEIFVNGEFVGLTPLEVELGRASEHVITLRWNGQERSFTLYQELDGVLAASAVPGGILIGLGVVGLVTCRPAPPDAFLDFYGVCVGLSLAGIGIGAIPIVADARMGGIFQLSPSEIFVAFE